MNRVTVCENALDPSTWETQDIEDLCAYLESKFVTWPQTAKIYLNQVAKDSDVTPYDEASIERLKNLQGHFFVIIYPEGIETILIIIAFVVAAAAIGLSFLLRPHIKTPNIKNQQETSPNNELSGRQNTERLAQRIPDIYGKVWSTPDLIALPYKIFGGDGLEREYAYMCVGRGSYTIDQVRDDITPVSQIIGMSVEVYGPNTSPNSGAPSLRIGAAIGEPVRYVRASTSINGQTLLASNLAGTGYIGYFLVGDATTTEVWFNFTAEAGSYQVDGTTGIQGAVNSTLQAGITPVDASGAPTGVEVFFTVTLVGSTTSRSRIGVTLKVTLGTVGMCLVRAKRTTPTTVAANISVSDEVKWRDCYAISPVTQLHFGNVTTVQTLTLPTPEALAIKERKLNLLVTRNIPIGALSGGVVTFAAAGPTRSAADIICAIAQDARLGNRLAAEIDFVGIYTAINAVAAYFGTTLCTEFCFTFDDSKVSFEEMVADIAAAVFCVIYRRGSVITLSFEKQTANSTLLFNHRNKVPKSETRTVTFGITNDLDGIELTYNEPNDPLSPNQDIAKIINFPPILYNVHSTGGSTLFKYYITLANDIVGHNYKLQVSISNLGSGPISVQNAIGGSVSILAGQSKVVTITWAGSNTPIQMLFYGFFIGDELNFNALNPYIADLADGINLIPVAKRTFTGWTAGTGATVTVSSVDSSSINPKKITAIGIRNNVQAYELGYRLYNKLLYQNTVTQFQATEEAALLVLNDRILVSDNTRSDTQDGEVIEQNSLLLTLSQPITFIGGRTYTIFLQHYDETIEAIIITQPDATKPYQVLLAAPPSITLVVDPTMWAKTTYWIVDSTYQRATAFLLAEKTPASSKIFNIKAVNYDDKYYKNDNDFNLGFVVSNGQEGTGTSDIAPGGTYRPSLYNDLVPDTGGGPYTNSSGTIIGVAHSGATPQENGDVIWTGFAPVKISANTTLHVVVSSETGTSSLLKLNGTNVSLSGAGTYTVIIPAHTYLSTVTVEVIAGGFTGGGTVVVTDIFIS